MDSSSKRCVSTPKYDRSEETRPQFQRLRYRCVRRSCGYVHVDWRGRKWLNFRQGSNYQMTLCLYTSTAIITPYRRPKRWVFKVRRITKLTVLFSSNSGKRYQYKNYRFLEHACWKAHQRAVAEEVPWAHRESMRQEERSTGWGGLGESAYFSKPRKIWLQYLPQVDREWLFVWIGLTWLTLGMISNHAMVQRHWPNGLLLSLSLTSSHSHDFLSCSESLVAPSLCAVPFAIPVPLVEDSLWSPFTPLSPLLCSDFNNSQSLRSSSAAEVERI